MLVGEGRPYPVLLAVSQETDEKALSRRANDQLKAFPRWMRVRRVIASQEPWSVENGAADAHAQAQASGAPGAVPRPHRGRLRGVATRVSDHSNPSGRARRPCCAAP